MSVLPPPGEPSPADNPLSGRRASRSLWAIAAVFACLLLTVIGLAAAGGYWVGIEERAARQTQAARDSVQEQFQLALADLDAGRYELARQRLEYVLRLDPLYPGARDKLTQAMQVATLTPTPEPTPTPSSGSAAEMLLEAQRRLEQKDWDGLISTLTALRTLDPAYEAVRVDGMLYLGFRSRGVERINGDQLEEGLYDLARAEAIGPLDTQALELRAWAEMYQTANSFWNVNWQKATVYFAELYAAAPYFMDTNVRYFQAVRNFADQLFAAGDYCGAQDQYAVALQLEASDDLQARHDLAAANCLVTPTPDPFATPSPSTSPDASATPDLSATPDPPAITSTDVTPTLTSLP